MRRFVCLLSIYVCDRSVLVIESVRLGNCLLLRCVEVLPAFIVASRILLGLVGASVGVPLPRKRQKYWTTMSTSSGGAVVIGDTQVGMLEIAREEEAPKTWDE